MTQVTRGAGRDVTGRFSGDTRGDAVTAGAGTGLDTRMVEGAARQPGGRRRMAGAALGRGHNVIARFGRHVRIDAMAGTAGRRIRHIGMIADRYPGRRAVTQIARIIGRNVAGYFARGGDAVAGLAGAGLDACMVEHRPQPGGGGVAAVALRGGGNVVARFAAGGDAVATGAGAGRNTCMIKRGPQPGGGGRMASAAFRCRHDVVVRLGCDIRIHAMAGAAGRWIRNIGVIAYRHPSCGAMTQVA